MIPVSYCKKCNHSCQVTLTGAYCVHPDNYMRPVDDYQIDIDAGPDCPINKMDENYYPVHLQLIEEKEFALETEKPVPEIEE